MMFIKEPIKNDVYESIQLSLGALLDDAPTPLAKLANMSALLNAYLEHINWVGFYLYENNQLQLGPFQGLPACSVIPLNRGVCGHAATTKTIIRVDDVHQFPGHIACDGASNSEIVIPILINHTLYGVLDIDSPIKNRFTAKDQEGLEACVSQLVESLQ